MPSDPEQKPTIVEALAAVMAEVESIGKGERNKDLGFRFRGIDAVLNAVGPAFRKHGVVCVPIAQSYETETYTTKKQTQMRNVVMLVRFRFYGPAGDSIDAAAYGEAADSGDKAISKAHSVAYRTLLLESLCIPTGDEDPDATSHERAVVKRQDGLPPVPLPKSWADLEKMVRAADNPEEAWALFKAFIRAASYHLFGQVEQEQLDQGQRDTLWQKAAGAGVWIVENAKPDGPFTYFDEPLIRQGWAHVLDGTVLEIPDYVPPEPPGSEEIDPEAERLAREAFAQDAAADYDSSQLEAEDTAPRVPKD